MARKLGISSVAEVLIGGLELAPEVWLRFREGFFIARPMEASQFPDWSRLGLSGRRRPDRGWPATRLTAMGIIGNARWPRILLTDAQSNARSRSKTPTSRTHASARPTRKTVDACIRER